MTQTNEGTEKLKDPVVDIKNQEAAVDMLISLAKHRYDDHAVHNSPTERCMCENCVRFRGVLRYLGRLVPGEHYFPKRTDETFRRDLYLLLPEMGRGA